MPGARPAVDLRESIPKEEIETVWLNAFTLIGGLTDKEAADVGRGILHYLEQQEGYPKRVYIKVVAS